MHSPFPHGTLSSRPVLYEISAQYLISSIENGLMGQSTLSYTHRPFGHLMGDCSGHYGVRLCELKESSVFGYIVLQELGLTGHSLRDPAHEPSKGHA